MNEEEVLKDVLHYVVRQSNGDIQGIMRVLMAAYLSVLMATHNGRRESVAFALESTLALVLAELRDKPQAKQLLH